MKQAALLERAQARSHSRAVDAEVLRAVACTSELQEQAPRSEVHQRTL